MFSATVSMDSGVRVAALQLALLLWGATTTATVAVAMERPKMGSAVDNGWPKADLGAHIPPRRILLDTSVHGGYAGGDREHMRWTNAIAVLRWHGGRNANKPPAPTFSRTLLQQVKHLCFDVFLVLRKALSAHLGRILDSVFQRYIKLSIQTLKCM